MFWYESVALSSVVVRASSGGGSRFRDAARSCMYVGRKRKKQLAIYGFVEVDKVR